MNATPNTETMPVLGRCKHPECDYALWSAAEDIRIANTLNDVVPGAAFRMADRGNLLARCPHRHKVFRLYQVEGELDANVKCDGRCEGARGHVCRCACGGMNHGRGHAGTVENVSAPTDLTVVVDADELEAARNDPKVRATLDASERVYEEHTLDEDALFGEVGEQIEGTALVTHEQLVSDATLFLFRAMVGDKFGTVKWFKPSYVNVNYAKGDQVTFTAKVKRHETEYGNATLVTYFDGKPEIT